MIENFNWRLACKRMLAPVALFMVAACSTDSRHLTVTGDQDSESGGIVILNSTGVFEISGPQGGPFPSGSRTYQIQNTSNSAAVWRLAASTAWLNTNPAAGALAPGQQVSVTVQVDQAAAALLTAGEYPAELRLRTRDSADGDLYIAFNLTVTPVGGPFLRVTPAAGLVINTDTNAASDELDGEIQIENSGSLSANWEALTRAPWLRFGYPQDRILNPGETDPLGIYVKEDAMTDLGLGTHQAAVVIRDRSNHAISTTIMVTVNLSQGQGNRITANLVAEYRFDEGSGSIVHDISGNLPSLDLHIQDPSAVTWQPSGLTIDTPTLLATPGAATRLTESVRQTGELTVEAWLRPDNLNQDGPARLIGISNGPSLRNFTLAQGLWSGQPKDTFNMRLRSTQSNLDGMPHLTTTPGTASLGMQHLVYTRSSTGSSKIYVNGALIQQGQMDGNTSNWDTSFRLAVANEVGAARPWLGEFFLLAIYDRALSETEVRRNMAAGNGASTVGHLNVTPGGEIRISSIRGNAPTDLPDDFRLINIGAEMIEWTANESASWLSLSQTSGNLQTTQSLALQIQLDNSAIANLPAGTHRVPVAFVNATSRYGTTHRNIVLTVTEPGAPPTGDRPGPHNTGPSNPSILQNVGGMTITQDGTVIENVRVFGAVNIDANNVTLRNFIIDAGGQPYAIRATAGKFGIVIEDGELINTSSALIYGGGFEARRLNIHESGGDGLKTTNDVLVEACWIHHLGTAPAAHADCNQTRRGSNFIFRGNNFDIPIDIGAPYKQNACWIVQTGEGPIDNVLIEDNWINGGNYAVYLVNKVPPVGSTRPNYGDPTNCRMINNRFGRDYRFGVLQTTGYVYISGNRWDDNGLLMDINNN